MKTFTTLDELYEFNKQGFEQVFGQKTAQRPKSTFKEGSFEGLKFNARPHEIFKLDKERYGSIDYADKFLPYIKKYYKGKGMWMYDGAELFSGLKKAERKLFTFDDHEYLISLINYTYPKGVLAEERKDRVQVSENEVLTFVEVDERENIEIHFKFGKRFKNYLKKSLENSEPRVSIDSLENKSYKTDKKTFQNFFDKELVHDNMMRYVLSTIGVESEANEFAEFNALFSKKVVSFMEDFTIVGKYKPYVFVEKSQRDVQLKTDKTINEGIKVTPKPNEIYIWLVHKNSSFIKVQLGTNVAKDLKEKEITQDSIEQLIINEIKAELDRNIYSKRTIDRATHRGLGDALIQLWIIERKESSELNAEIFDTNPALFLALQAANFAVEEIESYKFKEHQWNPKLENYLPLIEGDTLFNAKVCGFINGIIDETKAMPEMLSFFSKILGSEKEKEAFINGLKKLFEEGIFQAIIEGATKEYRKAIQEGNIERLYYNLAHDVIQIVSLLIGVFQLAKGVSSFLNFSRKGLQYIKRYGRKGINDLKKLNKKQVKEFFDELEEKQIGGKGPIAKGMVIGKYSKRPFNPKNAGGPILNLSWKNVSITKEGIIIVKKHLSRFEDVAANRKMIERIERILNKEIDATDWDKRFYTHEIREFERYKVLGYEETKQIDIPNSQKVWNDTHTATLEDYKISDKDFEGNSNLYHPDVEDIDFLSDSDRKLLGL
ncbi:conserved protein of unknown function [Tenacibaculum sp. 190130A14a]|uniref:AIPR protein n=1 Tax=Tenacibaculum polynesiense TaxID=3137857 RepID=A0ABM9PEK8_9FLAO